MLWVKQGATNAAKHSSLTETSAGVCVLCRYETVISISAGDVPLVGTRR